MSGAEKTLVNSGMKLKNKGWGCRSDDHVCANRDDVVFCPRAHEPEVKKRAEAERKKYVARMKEKRQSKKRKFQSYLSQAISDSKKSVPYKTLGILILSIHLALLCTIPLQQPSFV